MSAPVATADTGLAIQSPDSMAGYSRAQFGPPWTDANNDADGHNGCNTRDDILARDLTHVVRSLNCQVLSGVLNDPYTGKRITFRRGRTTSSRIQIDHVVALGDAWRTGAQKLSPQERIDLANDPRNLLAVDGPANDRKGDQDASTWLPPNAAFRCAYVEKQVEVKTIYHLFTTPAEHDAITRVLADCPQS